LKLYWYEFKNKHVCDLPITFCSPTLCVICAEDGRLERWIIRCKNRLEKTKTSVDMYYSLKTVMPEIMLERDPSSQWFQEVVNVA
jgi:hypothetical protein